MPRQPQTENIGGLDVTTTPLPFNSSQPLLSPVGVILSIGIGRLGEVFLKGLKKTDDALKLAPAFQDLFAHLEGRLEVLAPKILATTTVVMENFKGERQVYELGKEKDRSDVFDEHPEIYIPVLFFAGRVTFARFFPGKDLLAKFAQAGSAPSASSPST